MQQDHMVRVLGPIDVLTPAGPVAVGGRHARAVLGALAVGADHAVSIDHVSDVLWGNDPPESADNTLQSYISHLRQILGADAIVRVNHSYKLLAAADNIDALRFERLVGDAVEAREDPECSQDRCRAAIGLWRGRPFGDLADEEAFRLEAYRLDGLRLVVMELSLEAELSMGRHELIVGELESAVEEHPYREHLWYLLIAALARCDRRVEALRACARLRRELAAVGLEPTPALVAMEQEILAGNTPPIAG